MSIKDKLIQDILEIEWRMFIDVRSQSPAACQENPDAFRRHRKAQFLMWSARTLQSYLDDLTAAKEKGENLMTLKYARMQNLILPLKQNPIIDQIAQMQLSDQRHMVARYPKIMAKGRPLVDGEMDATSFFTYLKSELETYSERTLYYLLRDIQFLREKGENWSEKLYCGLIQSFGYESIDELEDIIDKNG